MSEDESTETLVTFKFSGKLARILGRESIADKITALAELVKNSYDADAHSVTIGLYNLDDPSKARIVMRDDGEGMSNEEFAEKWMIVGTDIKEREPYSVAGRRRVGEKGVGRFSVERLSREVSIRSKKKGTRTGFEVLIDWDRFEDRDVLFDAVPLVLKPLEFPERHTSFFEMELRRLRDTWTRLDVKGFARDMSFLVSPLEVDPDFRINLDIPEFPALAKELKPGILELAYYVLDVRLDPSGAFEWRIRFRDGDEEKLEQRGDPRVCGPLHLRVYYYRRGGRRGFRVSYPGLTLASVKSILEKYSNIRIYRDGMWVRPYGFPGEDWLALDLKRMKRLADLPASNQIVGYVAITKDGNPLLTDTTSREGLVRGEALESLKEFVVLSLEWAMRQWNLRLKEKVEKKKRKEPHEIIRDLEKKVIKRLPSDVARIAKTQLTDLRTAVRDSTESAEKSMALFKAQASLGISLVSIMHETGPRISQAITEFQKIQKELDRGTPRLDRAIGSSATGIDALKVVWSYMDYGLGTQQYELAEDTECDFGARVERILEAFDGVFRIWNIKPDTELSDNLISAPLRTIEADSILMNLMSNAYAVLREREEPGIIHIKAFIEDGEFVLVFWDNGPGIPIDRRELVFLEGFTTKRGGTGLGLKIVRDIVESKGGEFVIENDSRGGSHFLVRIPTKEGGP
jgi:signal transduction histidine kinase